MSLYGEDGRQPTVERDPEILYLLAEYFFHWKVSALASSGLPPIIRRPTTRRLRETNERPNIVNERLYCCLAESRRGTSDRALRVGISAQIL